MWTNWSAGIKLELFQTTLMKSGQEKVVHQVNQISLTLDLRKKRSYVIRMPSQKTSAIKSYNLTPCFGYIIELSLCVAGGKNCNSTKKLEREKWVVLTMSLISSHEVELKKHKGAKKLREMPFCHYDFNN